MTEVVKTKSGINIIFDELDNISTCSVGVFVKTGSKDEADNEAGISHVLEHMIFKGTPSIFRYLKKQIILDQALMHILQKNRQFFSLMH